METLLNGMLSKMGDKGIEKIAQSAGMDAGIAKTLLQQAGPLLTAKMADKAKDKHELAGLEKALQDHDGSVFDHIDDVANPDVDTKGSKILGHILGENTGDLVRVLSSKNDADSGSVGKLLEMAAPLVLGQLGSKKSDSGLDSAGLLDLLKKEKNAAFSDDGLLMDLATQFLDTDGDGSIVDDVLGMAGKFFNKK
ncbi:MAG: DUF937 domain-containing protein [Minisyncoccia bacterium]